MRRVSLLFHACLIAMEGVATDDDGDYFEGEVDFDLVVDGRLHAGLVARVKQAAGSSFSDPLEVLSPTPYAGPIHYGRYRECIERYVRDQVAAQPGERHEGDRNVRVRDVRLPAESSCHFAV